MKKYFIIVCLFFVAKAAFTQSCLPDGIRITSQEIIDDFPVNYPDCTVIGGDVEIFYDSVLNLNGLNSIISIEGDLIIMFASLSALSGLNNLSTVGGNIEISYCENLLSVEGLNSLDSIGGGLSISSNASIFNLTGLDDLDFIGGDLWIMFDDNMASLTGLENLGFIGGELRIYSNEMLSDLVGLESLHHIGSGIHIIDNSSLSDCKSDFLCNYLENPTGQVNIRNNAPGCNKPLEIASQCGFTLSCLPYGNYYLTSQSDVDSFHQDFPGCIDLQGSLTIQGDDIVSLEGLSQVNSIDETFEVIANPLLEDFSGMENLTSVGGEFRLQENSTLTGLYGLGNLNNVGSLLVYNNYGLSTLSGLNSLSLISDYLYLEYNYSLHDLSGIENLDSIHGGIWFDQNYSLVNLTALENTVISGDYVFIGYNPELTSLEGLENLNAEGITDLTIKNNPSLTHCAILSICDYLAIPASVSTIADNAPGCNSEQEIENICFPVSVFDQEQSARVQIHTNPGQSYISIGTSGLIQHTEVSVFNLSGQQVKNQTIIGNSARIDISTMPSGIYIIKIRGNNYSQVAKFVKN